jgi:hypothetical protein
MKRKAILPGKQNRLFASVGYFFDTVFTPKTNYMGFDRSP